MSTSASILEINRDLAHRINDEARADPASCYAGKFVGLANGQVISVADDLDEAIRLLLQSEKDPQKTFCFEAGRDYNKVEYIWETR